jgi:hypothetical protein
MSLLRIAAGSLTLCASVALHAQTTENARLGPAVYRSHFAPNPGVAAESGSRDGWESYPLVEDAGYDPTIQPRTLHDENALWRVSAPTQDGRFQLGFIKRLQMVAGNSASLRVRVRVPDAAVSTAIHLSIFCGAKEERHTAIVTGGPWHELTFNLLSSPNTMTAVAIAAEFPHATQGRVERVAIADVRLTALATQHLTVQQPSALWDAARSLYYLQRGVRPGEDLRVVLNAHNGAAATWTLASADGVVKAQSIGNEIQYRFALDDAPGVWKLRATSDAAETTALILLLPTQHKGLVFDQAPSLTPKLLESVRARRDLLRTTAHPEMGANIAQMNPDSLLPGLPSYFAILTQTPELAMLDAIDFRCTGDQTARDESQRLLREIARWPLWVHPWFPAHGYHSYYPVGMTTKFIVMAEQFLGNDLAKADREQLDQSLLKRAVKPIYEEYVFEDRLQFNTSNWIGNTVGGALLAALASDDPDAAGYALGLYVKERDHVREAYTSDGSYGEGTSYQRFDLEMTTLAAAVAKRLLGQSLDQSLMPADRYLRYATYGSDGLLDYGDSHVDLKPSNVFAYLASLNQSDQLTNFYFRYRDEGTAELLSRVLWEGSIHPVVEPLSNEPASRLFAQRGVAVLRDSWSPDASVIAMRAGKNFNHNHADQGSVFFARGGKLWLGEAGYADYYKDPAYATFNVQAIGHNALLVDGNPESQILPGNAVFGASPSVTHSLIAQQASLLQADLASAYAAKLTSYTRTLFFQKDGPLIIIDQVKANSPHTYTQVWHPKQRVDTEHNGFRLSDGSHEVSVRAFANSDLTTTRRESPLPFASYEKAERETVERPVRLEIATRVPEKAAAIVTVIQPDDHASLERATWKHEGSSNILTLGSAGVELEDLSSSIVAWWAHGALALRARHYRDRGTGGMLRSSKPIDMQITRGADGTIALEVEASEETELRLEGFALQAGAPHTIRLGAGHSALLLRDDPHR